MPPNYWPVSDRGTNSAGGYTNLSELGSEMSWAKEAHHFYPVLFYFRFSKSFYAVSRATLVAFDAVSLIKCALDDEKNRWLKEAGGITQLWEASMLLVTTLEETFLPLGVPKREAKWDQQTRDRWRPRYRAGLARLQRAGIETTNDGQLVPRLTSAAARNGTIISRT
jgi:hypothetical protein